MIMINYIKMKKQLILAFVMGLVLIIPNSCNEDQLNLDPNSDTEDSYFQTEDQFQRAVYGIYSKLSDQYWYRAGSSALPMMLLPGDDITTLGQDAFEVFSTINPTEDRLTYVYRALYQQISRACIFVDKNEEVADGIYVTPGLKDYNRGEALFLRAYAYYLLWN